VPEKEGAADYILKSSLKRLPSALRNVLRRQESEREQEKAEAALRRSEEQYRLITENSRDLICLLNQEGRFLYLSPSYREVLGYVPEDLLGHDAFALMHPEDEARLRAEFATALQENQARRAEYRYQHRNGEWRNFESVGSWGLNEQHAHYRAVIVSRDITERKQAEEKIRFRAHLLDEVKPGVIVTDLAGRISYGNRFAETLYGWAAGEAVERNITEVICAAPTPEQRAEMVARFQAGESWSGEFTVRHRDGTAFPALVTHSPIHDEQGQLIGLVSVSSDLTEGKRLADQLRQAQKMEAIGGLAGGVAHDFNNLLTAINGYRELLLGRLSESDPRRREISEIRKAGERAAALTRQVLACRRRQVLQPKVLDLNLVVADMEKILRRLIGEDIELITALAPDLGQVKADPGQIEQVIMNLAINARDAMPQGGKLIIETANADLAGDYHQRHLVSREGPHVLLAVTDTGCGLDAETQARIFEPFFTTKELGKGTGLGLSTVYGIVKQSGGDVWVYSEPGYGATFKVYLPQVAEAAEALKPSVAQTGLPRGSETILLVEDEGAVRKLVAELLTMSGYTVLQARQGSEALQLCAGYADPIQLLVTEVVMPQMSGRELADRLAPERPEMKVLYISGYTDDAIVHHGLLEAGVAFLQKPFTPESLARKVRQTLDAPRRENHADSTRRFPARSSGD
jgi:two-component system cell cycle sensor histidine kinase/response regulator CckA